MVATRFKKTQGGQTRRKEAHSGPLRARQGHKQGCWCLVSGRNPRDGSLSPGTGCSSRRAENMMLQ